MIPDGVFTLDAAKAHLRVPHPDEDAVITAMLDAAVAACERLTRRAWTAREWSVAVAPCDLGDCGCDSAVFHAELSPASAVVYDVAPDGTATALAPSRVTTRTAFGHTVVHVADWIATPGALGDVGRIDYKAKPTADVVPPDVYAAVMLYLGDLYENRESSVVGIATTRNPIADILLRPYVIDLHV